jgi:hypothetical protein
MVVKSEGDAAKPHNQLALVDQLQTEAFLVAKKRVEEAKAIVKQEVIDFEAIKKRIAKLKANAEKIEAMRPKSEIVKISDSNAKKSEDVKTLRQPEQQALMPLKTTNKVQPSATDAPKKKARPENELYEVLDCYTRAMQECWGVEVPFSTVNFRHSKNLINAVGYDNAKQVAHYYPSRREKFYLQKGHDLRYAVLDATKLMGEIQTGIKKTNSVIQKLAKQEEQEAYEHRKQLGLESEFWNDENEKLEQGTTETKGFLR